MTTILDVDGVLFDNDGVLSDSIASAGGAWDRWAVDWAPGFSFLDNDEHGVRARDIVARLVAADRLDDAVAALERAEMDSSHDTAGIPGAAALTAALGAIPWAVVSSATEPLLRVRLVAAGIAEPRATVAADDVTHGKPHPEPYLAGARAIGVDPARCVVFEDAPAGIAAARAAGIGVVVGVGESSRAGSPDHVVPDLTAVAVVDGRITLTT